MTSVGMRIDNYTLTRQLGTNVFGPVWAARESILERLVSINILNSADGYEIARFTRAIALLSRLNHPHIAVHTGHGFVDHRPYLATEYVHGPTLATLLAQGGRMDERKVLQLALQVAEGLGHAWEKAAVIHRNLGPQTIVVDLEKMEGDPEGISIRIIDFGHALGKRLVDAYDREAVAEEAAFQREANKELVGSPMTMSPEQVAGARLTVASDMYALGVTMYLLLTGAAPFTGTDDEVKASHQRVQPLELRSLVPGLQAHTAALVKRLLSKTPGARFADWEACQQKIREALDSLGRRRQPVAPATSSLRKTQTFDKTPVGHSIPMGPEIPEPILTVPARYSQGYTPSAPAAQVPSPGMPSGVQATGLSADDVLLLATHAANLRRAGLGASLVPAMPMVVGAPAGSAVLMVPAVDDGLTPEQRLAMWVHLFRSPAIADASLRQDAAAQAHDQAPSQVHAPTEIPSGAQEALVPRDSGSRDGLADEPVAEPEMEAEASGPASAAEPQSFADLFDESTPAVAVPEVQRDGDQAAAAPADIPCNPLQSRYWKHTLEILRDATLGTVRYEAPTQQSLTRRVTRSFLKLVAKREPSRDEILALILSGKFDEAEAHINRIALSIKPDNTSGLDDGVCLLRARLMGLRGDLPGAMAWAQQAIRLDSGDPGALALVGVVHLQQRRVQTSVSVFDELAQRFPQSPLGPLGQGAVLFLGGLESKADLAIAEAERRQAHPALIRLQALRCRAHGDAEGEVTYLKMLLTGTSADWAIQERLREITGG